MPSASVSNGRKRGAGKQVDVDLRRIAVIMLTLGGHELECSRSHIENLIWDGNAEGNSVVDVFERATYGTKTIAADVDADGKHDVFGPFSIEFDGTCNYGSWRDQADAAADAAGLELSVFQHRVYVLPYFHGVYTQCSWRGLGDFGWCVVVLCANLRFSTHRRVAVMDRVMCGRFLAESCKHTCMNWVIISGSRTRRRSSTSKAK